MSLSANHFRRLRKAIALTGTEIVAVLQGGRLVGITAEEFGAGSSGGLAKKLVLENVVAGATTGWIPAAPFGERFWIKLHSGANAQLAIDGSNDGLNSAGNLAQPKMDTVGELLIGPLFHRYNFIRVRHLSGDGVVSAARGA